MWLIGDFAFIQESVTKCNLLQNYPVCISYRFRYSTGLDNKAVDPLTSPINFAHSWLRGRLCCLFRLIFKITFEKKVVF